MGYTHYYSTAKVKNLNAKQLETLYQRAIKKCAALVRAYNADLKKIEAKHPARLSGYSAHAKGYNGLHINGTADLSHEDFILREHFSQNFDGNFVKTNQKPYDIPVVACLIILKFYLGDAFKVNSDGDRVDWTEGLQCAQYYSGLKGLKIPDSIRARQPRLAIVS